MMDSGKIVLDIDEEAKKGLTVKDLLDMFREVAGKNLDNDRILLSQWLVLSSLHIVERIFFDGDMIDLNRENIRGFDVREFYVQLVANLKERGL